VNPEIRSGDPGISEAPDRSNSLDGLEEILITGLSSGGDGVGRASDGRVVFVDGGIPGERVELVDVRVQKKLIRARVGRILEASPDRVDPPCPHFGSCGGCRWQHLGYSAQLEAKRQIVRDALTRIGGLSIAEEIEIIPSPEAYGYRARARWVESEGGVGYRVRGSRSVYPVDACSVLVPSAEAALVELASDRRERAAASEAGPASPKKGRGRVVEWVATMGSDQRTLVERSGGGRAGRGRDQKRQSVVIEVSGEKLRVSPESFVQGNALLWEALATEVCAECLTDRDGTVPARFVELYSGIGFFTLPLARRGLLGVALESDRSALADLAYNLRRSGLVEQVEVLSGRVESRGDLTDRIKSADLLLVDPPRIGLESRVRAAIAASGPARCVYVSCDPATLARDLRELCEGGYSIASLKGFDLFPQIPHVETLVRLERR